MVFNLIEGEAGAVPLRVLSKAGLAAWRETAPARERDWAAATGFTGEAGKLALVPDQAGKLGRVLVGASENDAAMWALAGLSEKLPEGNYRLERGHDGGDPTRLALGWALGTYAFTLYRDKKKEYRARLVWPEGADRGLAERLANAVCLARDLINTPASDLGPAELAEAAVTVAENAGAKHRVITGDALPAENYPTIHAVGRASSRQPRLVDIRWGDEHAPKVTLVGKGVCFDSGGLDLKPASGMRMMKKDMGGAARVALGPELPALFCNDDKLAEGLTAAGSAEDDPMWRLPLWRSYRKLLDSKAADINNVSDGPHAGAITAALYLQEFVEPGIPWAHLDVMAWNTRARPGRPEGAEAQTLRAVYAYITRQFA